MPSERYTMSGRTHQKKTDASRQHWRTTSSSMLEHGIVISQPINLSVLGKHQRHLRGFERAPIDLVGSIEVNIGGVLSFSRDSNEHGVRHTSATESRTAHSDRAGESTSVRGSTLERSPRLWVCGDIVLSQGSQLHRV